MIAIPGVIGFCLGYLLPRDRAYASAVAVWAAVAAAVAAFGLTGDDGGYIVPALIALVLTLILTAAGHAVGANRRAKAAR